MSSIKKKSQNNWKINTERGIGRLCEIYGLGNERKERKYVNIFKTNFMPDIALWLSLILLTWRIWWAPNNANKWQMGFNWAGKGLTRERYFLVSQIQFTIKNSIYISKNVTTYRSFATRKCRNSQFGIFVVIGMERNVCICTSNRYSVITQFAKLAAGEQLCRRCAHCKL
jgi:hypothetical protein